MVGDIRRGNRRGRRPYPEPAGRRKRPSVRSVWLASWRPVPDPPSATLVHHGKLYNSGRVLRGNIGSQCKSGIRGGIKLTRLQYMANMPKYSSANTPESVCSATRDAADGEAEEAPTCRSAPAIGAGELSASRLLQACSKRGLTHSLRSQTYRVHEGRFELKTPCRV